MPKKLKIILLVSLILLLGIPIIWVATPYHPMTEAFDALASDERVAVDDSEWIVFTPKQEYNSGLIFYPGGRVEPESYAPLMKEIAKHGYLVVLVPMPLNLAVFSPNKADDVLERYSEITKWAIGRLPARAKSR